MAELQTLIAQRFAAALTAAFGPEYAGTDPLIRPSGNPKFGDYQANLAMSLGKTLKVKPRDVAQKIVDHLDPADIFDKVEIAGPGFINLHVNGGAIAESLRQAAADSDHLGIAQAQPQQRVVVDYSGPNVAKEMHVGHLRSTVIGDALARVLEFQGHTVVRQNHLGDWGTQFGMLIEYLHDLKWDAGGAHSIGDLNDLYKQSKAKFDADPEFKERAYKRVVLLQGGDGSTLALWQALIDESKHHFNNIYQLLGVKLSDADLCPESFYNPQLPGVVADLEKAGLVKESAGALCVFPPGFTNPEGQPLPLIIRKTDGGYLYATTDLAAIRYRSCELKADRVVYVTDARQKQHFAMVFKVAEMAGWVGGRADGYSSAASIEEGRHPVRLDHVPFGTVLGEDNKPFKTRSGDTVKLGDLLKEAEERALALVTAKNPELSPQIRGQVARAVGIGAIKYADLANDRVKDYVFSWDRMLSFEGNTAPYMQNAYVRIRSIFRKGGIDPATIVGKGSVIGVDTPAERALALKLLQFPSVIAGVAEALEPHRLCTYLFELAGAYHQFYENCPVLTAETPGLRDSRLALCDLTARTLKQGLELLGIQTVEQM